jgi:hypothetical protein
MPLCAFAFSILDYPQYCSRNVLGMRSSMATSSIRSAGLPIFDVFNNALPGLFFARDYTAEQGHVHLTIEQSCWAVKALLHLPRSALDDCRCIWFARVGSMLLPSTKMSVYIGAGTNVPTVMGR